MRARSILMDSLLIQHDDLIEMGSATPADLIDGWSDLSEAMIKQVRSFEHYVMPELEESSISDTKIIFVCDDSKKRE